MLIGILLLCVKVLVQGSCDYFPIEQYNSLKDLYYSTDGPNWRINGTRISRPWNFPVGVETSAAPCIDSWEGVSCSCNSVNNATGNFSVTRLILSYFSLNGFIPSSIGYLSDVKDLDLSNNIGLNKSIPDSITDLSQLRTLFITQTRLSGTIPTSIYKLQLLEQLDLSENVLSGSIPNSIGGLTSLRFIDISLNRLVGTIPSSLGNLSLLQGLGFYTNFLTGTIPSSICELTELRYLDFDTNDLTGTIPSNIGNLVNMQYLFFYTNMLNGTIPSSFGNLTSIRNLYLNNNQLSGTIPPSFGNLTSMTLFYLNNNFLSGTIPSSIGNLSSVQFACFITNSLTGTIPDTIGNLTSLRSLYLGYNRITGTIPSTMSSLSTMRLLYLNNNLLHGTIPPNIGNLSLLTSLYFNNNEFTGEIPSSIGEMKKLKILWLFSNNLSGLVPSEIGSLYELSDLLLNNNKLSGQFFNIYAQMSFSPSSNPDLLFSTKSINIADNFFSGSLSVDFKLFPYLHSLEGTNNCLIGSIPDSICQINAMSSIILDVAGGNSGCFQNIALNRHKPFLIKGLFTELGISGSLPSCLLSLPNITTLRLSGNQIYGVIPEITNNDSVLSILTMSNNKFRGTIPLSIQGHSFQELDLSNNRLEGTLIESFVLSPTQTVLGLSVNRLSGPLPNSLSNHVTSTNKNLSLNILASNVFSCNSNDIPSDDPASNSYSCGLFNLNLAYVTFSVAVGLLLIFVFLAIFYKFYYSRSKVYQGLRELLTWYSHKPSSSNLLNETKGFLIVLLFLQKYSVFLTIIFFIIFLPIYIGFNTYNIGSIVSYQYGYIVSMAFLHGDAIVILLSILVFISLFGLSISTALLQKLFSEYFNPVQPNFHYVESRIQAVNIYSFISFLHLINIVVTVCINAVYVNSILNSINSARFVVFQVGISAFKVVWNGLYIPWATRILRKYVTSSTALRSRYFMAIVNFILAPTIATVLVNQSCFYYVIQRSNPLSTPSSVLSINCNDLNNRLIVASPVCKVSTLGTTQSLVYPPYHYSYACGTAFLISYLPVVFYLYVINGFLLPILRLIYSFDVTKKLSYLTSKIGINPNFIQGQNILVDILIHVTVLLTFGLASPILAAEIGLTIFIQSSLWLSFVGKLLLSDPSLSHQNPMNVNINESTTSSQSSKDLSAHSQMLLLEYVNIKDSWRSLIVCVDMIVVVVVSFWSWLFFDMIADVNGWVDGAIGSSVYLVITTCLVIVSGYQCLKLLRFWNDWEDKVLTIAREFFLFNKLSLHTFFMQSSMHVQGAESVIHRLNQSTLEPRESIVELNSKSISAAPDISTLY